MTTPAKPIAWSYSSLKKFDDCPLRYYEERVAKSVKRRDTEQSLWGERVHKGIELKLTKETPLTGELAPYSPIIERFGTIKGERLAEQQYAITNSFKPAGWFAPDVWCRGILDAAWVDGPVGKVVDWKTGKRRQDVRQLKLFALLMFAHRPEVERVNTSYVWLATGKMDVEKFYREDVPVLWQDFMPDVRRLEAAHRSGNWVPRPGGLCGWCPVDKCTFWKGYNGEHKR